jgi:MATE family multidrug resistance protein
VVNVIINYVLIFGKLGFPQMGIIGAAIGTLVSRVIMFIFLFFLLYKRDVIRKYISYIFKFIINTEMIKKIVSLGLPTSLQMLFEVGIFTAAIWLSGLLGEITQAANQIVLNISSMTFMIASGLSVSAAIRAGNQKGLNNYKELKRISLSILLLGIIFATVFSLLIFFLRNALPYIYIDISDSLNYHKNLEIVGKAATLFIVVSLFQLFDSAQVIILGTLRGMQDVIIPTIIVFIAYWVVGFPVSYYFGDISQYKEIGIWFGLLCGLLFSSVFLYLRFIYLTNRMIKNAK